MDNQTTPLKKLPNGCTKQQLYKFYRTPESTIRMRINLIIYDARKLFPENKNKTVKDIIRSHYVERNELIEYAESYGYPLGFEAD